MKRLFRRITGYCACAIVLSVIAASAAAAQDDALVSKVRKDHPRLFFTRETWPQVKARALGPERGWYDQVKAMVDKYPDTITHEYIRDDNADVLMPDGSVATVQKPRPREWGVQAARTAFVYLVTGDKRYLDKAKKMLEVSVAAYNECIASGMAVDWYSTSRVHWLAAYDWLYNELSRDERHRLMGAFLEHVDSIQPRPERPPIHRLNDSNHTTGFYGDRNLVWFTGVTALGDGIDDDLARRFLILGHQYNMDLFEYRAKCAGDDGGLASATTTYAIAHYPWSQINFLLSWRAATGEDISGNYPYLAYFPVWIMWNWLPGPEPREFGSGDVYHYDNHLWVENLYTHMSQFMDFYGRSEPECAALAAYIRSIIPSEHSRHNWTWFFYPFLLTNIDKAPEPRGPRDTGLRARHFETLGQVFMRSGAGPDDTYCLYTIGSQVPSHKQYDENNFIIYKKGWLAMDTGTRGISTSYQLQHYYSQTVAHNCVLIHMPNEPFASYWGPLYDGPEGKISCGGMYKPNGGVCRAFETNARYTYVCGDATPCYRPEKCALALRQFVFVYPDYFVICDRVTSADPDYRKAWLLHTQNEPVVDGAVFRADHEEGRLFCRTVWPKDAALTKIGGPGKEFWACGKNWELAPETAERARTRHNGALFGNWRMEVSPGKTAREDIFVHVIQTGNQALARMDTVTPVEKNGMIGARISAADGDIEVLFAADGDPKGHVSIASGTGAGIDKDLATDLQPQSGLAGK